MVGGGGGGISAHSTTHSRVLPEARVNRAPGTLVCGEGGFQYSTHQTVPSLKSPNCEGGSHSLGVSLANEHT